MFFFKKKIPIMQFGSYSPCLDCLNPFETTPGLVLPDNWEQFCNHPSKCWVQNDCQELIVSDITDWEGRQKTCDILEAGFLCEATVSFSLIQRHPKSYGFQRSRLIMAHPLLSLSLLQSIMTPLCRVKSQNAFPKVAISLLFVLD